MLNASVRNKQVSRVLWDFMVKTVQSVGDVCPILQYLLFAPEHIPVLAV